MKIVMIASEVSPFSKTGGLGDAVGGLSGALASLGHQVTCLAPYYRCSWDVANAKPTGMKLTVPIGQKQVAAEIWEAGAKAKAGSGKPRMIFVRRDEYYDRSDLYGTADRDYEDNAERFIFFCKAAVEWMRTQELVADVVHCHDWQTALVPVLIRVAEQSHKTRIATRTVFTIHNLAYQGIFWSLDFPMTNLPWQFFTPDGLEFYGQMNLMKAGILFSDLQTTVSKKYAQEILTPEYGFGLDHTLRSRSDRLRGILNGADYEEWDPSRDPHIARKFSASDIDGKRVCKQALLKEFGMDAHSDGPLIGMISRLTGQKGFDIIEQVLEEILQTQARMVVLIAGESKREEFWRDASRRHPMQVGTRIAFDHALAHRIEAGADMFLMPSRYEPCGLNQMYSLRYGAIPIVRATGGLDDTIEEFDPPTGRGNGFKFEAYTGAALLAKCEHALTLYGNKPFWKQVQQNAMACEFSWADAAREYLKLYEKG